MALTEKAVREIVRDEIKELKTDVRSLEVKFEDFDDKLDGIAEMIEVGFGLNQVSKQLDSRVTNLEADMSLVKSVLRDK
jgi:predicted RNase H-like nuclease (RuvC/YqgF family)